MGKLEKRLAAMRRSPTNVRYDELYAVCVLFFGPPRTTGGSNAVFATPWQGDPRVNIQNRNGQAVPYQVRQVLAAIERQEEG